MNKQKVTDIDLRQNLFSIFYLMFLGTLILACQVMVGETKLETQIRPYFSCEPFSPILYK